MTHLMTVIGMISMLKNTIHLIGRFFFVTDLTQSLETENSHLVQSDLVNHHLTMLVMQVGIIQATELLLTAKCFHLFCLFIMNIPNNQTNIMSLNKNCIMGFPYASCWECSKHQATGNSQKQAPSK